jgi:hypothetical protein
MQQTEFEGGTKRTGRKPVYHLVPVELMEAVADTRAEGDCKYEPGNWEQGSEEFFVDCLSHAIEHLMLCSFDEDESIETHLGHAATNIGFILWALKRGRVTRESFQRAGLIVGRTTKLSSSDSLTQPLKMPSRLSIEPCSTVLESWAAKIR